MEQREASQLLHDLLAALSDDLRDVLVLVELEEFTVREASEALGIRLRTCQRRLRAAVEAIRGRCRVFEGGSEVMPMNQLSPEARRLFQLARAADAPNPATLKRIEHRLASRLAGGVGVAAASTLWAQSASGILLGKLEGHLNRDHRWIRLGSGALGLAEALGFEQRTPCGRDPCARDAQARTSERSTACSFDSYAQCIGRTHAVATGFGRGSQRATTLRGRSEQSIARIGGSRSTARRDSSAAPGTASAACRQRH